MNIPPLPSPEQLIQALTPATLKLTKRNINITLRLVQGETLVAVARTYGLSKERTLGVALEALSVLKRRLLSEDVRRQEFATSEAQKLSDYRHPERQAWWSLVLLALVPHAPKEHDLLLEKRPSGITLFTRCVAGEE